MIMSVRQLIGRFVRKHPRLWQWSIAADNWVRGSRVRERGKRNHVTVRGVNMVRTQIQVEGEDNILELLPGTRLFDSCIRILGSGHHIQIGRDCIFDRLLLNVQSRNAAVVIGDGTEAAPVRMDLVEPDVSLNIGRDCMISRGVEILCSDSHPLIDVASGRRLNPPKSVVIGEHVWLGAYTIVLKGATIGSHSVIGLRSTVSSKIPDGVIAVGSPAMVIRSGVTWHRELP
jgi:acetyltransferase-like isoleucine patch superfamily enzyme